ncbi:hypothetical protein QWE_19623 [Agrobacterium albertimagni AOL15]|jgi:hypothetical protein|uniref:Transmembrane protein n=1 Tax=Agrobacterium albertimagni AOL15 TaxID=1156935 RepID=K2PA01_9HYPH|nr:hypothetical protein [Agrobacterium albertimagni]EKF57738.1 hypothetical protein QWE_19623 [Agrobacterium albertimagni AOL15]
MWFWLKENHAIVSALSSLAMLGVWMLYLHLFYSSYRHQIRPKILITRGGGDTVAARCIVTNMSSETIFVQAVFLRLSYPDREQIYSLSETDRAGFSPSDRRSELVQGPLRSGDFLDLGSFEDLLSSVIETGDARQELAAAHRLSVLAVGSYTWHDRVVAAERSFRLKRNKAEEITLIPTQVFARQITSRAERRRVAEMMEQEAGLR